MMPEFHLRRKRKVKDNHRRHTFNQRSQEQLQMAMDMYEEHNEIVYGPNEISVDEALAGRRYNTASMDDNSLIQSTTSSSEPTIKGNVVRKISSTYSECLYLRYATEMRRCPMPSPITLTTIKQLFVNMFDLSPTTISDPSWHLFLLDRANIWKPLEAVNSVYDHCTILLVDSSDIGTLIPSPMSMGTRPSRSSTGTPDNDLLYTPSPHDLRPLSWSGSSPEVVPRPKSLDISMLPSVSSVGGGAGGTKDGINSDIHHFSLLSVQDASNEVFPVETLKRHSFALPPKSALGLQMLGLFNRVQHLKHDLAMTREEHRMRVNEINLQFQMSKNSLLAAVKGVSIPAQGDKDVPTFRQERLALDRVKQEYIETSRRTTKDLCLLQAIIEELRLDAVNRRCNVDADEVEALMRELQEHRMNFKSLQSQYGPIEVKLKEVMKEELTVIVEEETFVEQEPLKLDENVELCSQLFESLQMLKHFSSVQKKRSPNIPIFSMVSDPNREALLVSIASIKPNHSLRLENIRLAEDIQQKRKQELTPSRRALKEFERSLKEQQTKLRSTNYLEEIETQHEKKLKSFYMDEKIKRQQELEKELQIKEVMKKKKKQKEMDLIKAKLKVEESHLREEEERHKEELKKVKLEKERLEVERKRNEEERKRLEELKKQQAEEQRRSEELKRREEEERARREEERLKLLEENLRLEMEKEKAEERRKLEQERLHQVEEMLKIEKEREKLEERKKFEEGQKLLDELLSSDSPRLKAKRRDHMWRQIQERAQLELEEEHRRSEKTKQLRSQQMVMDSFDTDVSMMTGAGSTPLISRNSTSPKGTEYRNGFTSHHSNPYLPQDNRLLSDQRFSHVGLTDSDPLHRKLTPSLSTGKVEPSYDTLEKLFKSEENVTQNHYDLPWNSKKLPLGAVGGIQRRGTFGSSPGNHRRNKSEGISDAVNQPNSRENLTPSPRFNRSFLHGVSQTPPPKSSSFSSSVRPPRSPLYDDVTPRNEVSPTSNGHPSSPPAISSKVNNFTTADGSPFLFSKTSNVLPSYSQVMNSTSSHSANSSPIVSGYRQRSHTANARTTHYPLSTVVNNHQKQKPSISYV